MSQERRRRSVFGLHERYRASDRKVCRLVAQNRIPQRHPAKAVSIEQSELSCKSPLLVVLQ